MPIDDDLFVPSEDREPTDAWQCSAFETRAIHVGQEPDPTTGAVITPIYQTSTYVQESVGVHKGYEYSRTDNPTRTALQQVLASLEGGQWALSYASGLAATQNIFYLLRPGDHVLLSDDAYGGTYRLVAKVISNYGIDFSLVDMSDLDAVRQAIRPETKIVWVETPTNPYLKIVDIRGVAALLDGHPARLVVDNTFASPYLQQPLALGADLVLHSTTKYLGGHSDVVGGAVIGNDPAVFETLKFNQNAAGAVPGPFDCWLTLRGIKTLALRMERHSANAHAVARFLRNHEAVERVYFPGLPEHPGHDVALRQMRDFSGMVSFTTRGGYEVAADVVARTKVFQLAESLGGVESLIEHPGRMTHASVAGTGAAVEDTLIRLSVGIEHADDLIADLRQALNAVVEAAVHAD
ncbi:MAG: cystathionine gamma-synthase [Thermomicrobiales bacterium]|jgi:cystathionine beta-lyase/cystathionine gamma-synthase|nr:cystathionine gamma-synthase [Thermomicrobiales bacterium]MEA2523655.1 cystathionine gamma-synthase [Thermomicrobiales bacterium]MEA2583645.1 cystathionine gamma-synthase [Thermomicrobiales bacterium]